MFNFDICLQELHKGIDDKSSTSLAETIIVWYGIYKIAIEIDALIEKKKPDPNYILAEHDTQSMQQELIVAEKVSDYVRKQYLFKQFDMLISKVSEIELHQMGVFLVKQDCPKDYFIQLLSTLKYGLNLNDIVMSLCQDGLFTEIQAYHEAAKKRTHKYPECCVCMKTLDFRAVVYDRCPHAVSVFCGGGNILSSRNVSPGTYICSYCPPKQQQGSLWRHIDWHFHRMLTESVQPVRRQTSFGELIESAPDASSSRESKEERLVRRMEGVEGYVKKRDDTILHMY